MTRARDVFFYGTLLDTDVLTRVVGHAVPSTRLIPGTIQGYQRVYVQGEAFPTLVEGAGVIDGLVYRTCGPKDWERIFAYERAEYDLAQERAQTEQGAFDVHVFVKGKTQRATDKHWDYPSWRRLHKRSYLRSI
ncbi:gamma-glutamylcyclotransferase family protein [Magnetovibrio sp. PR-2]|uniref:gamma-glutamylcyclotransferase family protein n=1 Tax=Magnetovibrio sp. PR-2 TaxID=3120356 RepID=UPI002FCE164F